jgi:hypothetical protein
MQGNVKVRTGMETCGSSMACKGSGVQIPSAPPGTTLPPLLVSAPPVSRLSAGHAMCWVKHSERCPVRAASGPISRQSRFVRTFLYRRSSGALRAAAARPSSVAEPRTAGAPPSHTWRRHRLTRQWTHFSRACPTDGASRSAGGSGCRPGPREVVKSWVIVVSVRWCLPCCRRVGARSHAGGGAGSAGEELGQRRGDGGGVGVVGLPWRVRRRASGTPLATASHGQPSAGKPAGGCLRAITAPPEVPYSNADPPAASITVARSSYSRSTTKGAVSPLSPRRDGRS